MGRVFSEEHKKDAVKILVDNGISAAKVSKDLGIGKSTLEKWLRSYRSSNESQMVSINEREELRKLKAESHKLRLERELLKKAAVFLPTTPRIKM